MPAVQDDDDEVISAINVTPLVDVTLVLLIIFMVTATYIVSNTIPVDLPEASTGEEVASTVVVYIDRSGKLHIDGKVVNDDKILSVLKRAQASAKQNKMDLRAIISADREIRHKRFVRAVDLVRQAGISRFAIDVQDRGGDDDDTPEDVQP
jgi:biopolymer transport protein ExbD